MRLGPSSQGNDGQFSVSKNSTTATAAAKNVAALVKKDDAVGSENLFNLLDLSPSGSCSTNMMSSEAQLVSDDWATKRIIFIRHGRSTWNEFLGHHKKSEWAEQEQAHIDRRNSANSASDVLKSTTKGFRGAWRAVTGGTGSRGSTSGGYPSAGSGSCSGPAGAGERDVSRMLQGSSKSAESNAGSPGEAAGSDATARTKSGGLMQVVRGGVRHVTNAFNHAEATRQVDHALSPSGIAQARLLRKRVAQLASTSTSSEFIPRQANAESNGADTLLMCQDWYVSPFLRALQTAAFALSPLYRRDPALRMLVCQEAGEIVLNRLAYDCMGKHGNVGHRVLARALSRTSEAFEEDEDDPDNSQFGGERQLELADISATLCAMDLREVGKTWWKDVAGFKKEHIRAEDARVRRLVARLLKHRGSSPVGVVAHSILFQRLIQMFWPRDPALHESLRAGLRNGAPADTKDPYNDKMMNCGTLVLTWRYRESQLETEATHNTAEIVGAEFLFDGHMEAALGLEQRTVDMDGTDDFSRVEEHCNASISDTVAPDDFSADLLEGAFLPNHPPLAPPSSDAYGGAAAPSLL